MTSPARTLCALGVLALALPGTASSAVYSARVRWRPTGDGAVTGYRVHVRPADGGYGTPRDAGMPAMAGDGTYSIVVEGLDVRTDYALAVTAYTGDGDESGRSNEVAIGYAEVAPLVDSDGDGLRDAAEDVDLNRRVDPGETDPTRPDTDGDGVRDGADRCGDTAAGAAVNPDGCACTQVTCDDGDACNGVETCQAGVCRPGTAPNCDDGNPCTSDGCRAASGCTHTAVPSCTACTTNAQCEDGNPCTADVCSAGTCRSAPVANGAACSDGDACNGAETCQAGACRPGTALACDDGNACTTDGCAPSSGCTHSPIAACTPCSAAAQCDDGNPCTAETCTGGACQRTAVANGTACADGDACNGAETCQGGVCRTGTPLACDDGDGCTTDACAPAAGCSHTPNGTCGACPRASVIPAEGGTVTGATTGGGTSRFTAGCEPTTGATPDAVFAWTPAVSGVATISTCGAATRYDTVLSLRSGACDGGQELGCNDDTDGCAVANGEVNAARNGSRITAPVAAGETYYIIVDGYDGRWGEFSLTVTPPVACTAARCDDGNPCTTDACSPTGSCTHTSVAGCTACTADAQCADSDPCTADVCTAGRCERHAAPDGTGCEDGNACNGVERCRAGRCTAGAPLSCDDGNACTTDGCNPSAGCTHASVSGCTACSTSAQCDDGNVCTTDTCTAGRCLHAHNTVGCDDGIACTAGDTCADGTCAGTASCAAGETCNRTSGTCEAPPTGLLPVADTFIQNDGAATWDHGTADFLNVDGYPRALSYLKFDLGAVDGVVTSARLTLHCVDASSVGGAIYPVADSRWVEGTRDGADATSAPGPGLTWADVDTNRDGAITATDRSPYTPDFSRPLASIGGVSRGQAYTVDVTAAFQRGAGLYTLALQSGSTNGAGYASREHADPHLHPRLQLEVTPRRCESDAACDDGDACTTDRCAPATGCSHAPIPSCRACTTAAQCEDGNPCTAEVCTAGRCERTALANGAPCGEGNVCTGGATCQAGVCTPSRPLRCDDGDACTADSCDPAVGCVRAPIPSCRRCRSGADCDDGQACTADACAGGRCTSTPLADGAACGDGNFCNGQETCQAGHCTPGAAVDCDDHNACTTDTCDPAAGQCTHTSIERCCTRDADCADADACTEDERCVAGRCVSDRVDCGEPAPCQELVCDPATGCGTQPLADGSACDDGDPCTRDERCTAGTCAPPASAAAATPDLDLEATDFVLKRINKRVWRLAASGWFATTSDIDPTRSGLVLEILDGGGTSLYQAAVSGRDIAWRNGRFAYSSAGEGTDDGLRKVELVPEDGGVTVNVWARVPARVAHAANGTLRRGLAASTTDRHLTWMLSLGDTCMRDRTVVCQLGKSAARRCR